MKIINNNISGNLRKLILRYSPLLLLSVMLSFVLSELIVTGSEIISDAINAIISQENISMKDLCLKMGIIIVISMLLSFLQSLCGGRFSVYVQRECTERM